jgi:hypothetical protein
MFVIRNGQFLRGIFPLDALLAILAILAITQLAIPVQAQTNTWVKNVFFYKFPVGHNGGSGSGVAGMEKALDELAAEKGFTVIKSDKQADMAKANLIAKNIQVVLWPPNEGGDACLAEGTLQTGFMEWVEAGGGFISQHAANGLGSWTWAWNAANVVQPYIADQGDQITANVSLYDSTALDYAKYPLPYHMKNFMKDLPKPITLADEWYSIEADPRSKNWQQSRAGWDNRWNDRAYGLQDIWPVASIDDNSWVKDGVKQIPRKSLPFHPIIWHHKSAKGLVALNYIGHGAPVWLLRNAWAKEVLWREIRWTSRDPAYWDSAVVVSVRSEKTIPKHLRSDAHSDEVLRNILGKTQTIKYLKGF